MDRDQACRTSFGACGIPDQPRIEGLDREHRQHHHRREEKQARPRLHRHQRLELDQRGGEGVDEHVDHRPASDELDHPVEPDPLRVVLDRPALRGDEQVGQRQDLRARDHDAREEHDQRQRPSRSATTAARRLAGWCRTRRRRPWSWSTREERWPGCNRPPRRSGRPTCAGSWPACERPAPRRSAGSALRPRPARDARAGRRSRSSAGPAASRSGRPDSRRSLGHAVRRQRRAALRPPPIGSFPTPRADRNSPASRPAGRPAPRARTAPLPESPSRNPRS